ncbi:MAG TPA: Crp/Fnr family transcriptional regulator [Methylomirabilota bacterium]|nr:Crp/Fnr family transcriptional regulator [Methylomirabilota bacterium]
MDVTVRNSLLKRLPEEERRGLLQQMEPVELKFKHVLYETDGPIDYIYFVESGVISLLTRVDEKILIEIATVGREGFGGLQSFLGARRSPGIAVVQVPGEGFRWSAEEFRKALETHPKLVQTLNKYTQALISQISINSACNRAHLIDQRAARWLLLTRDRVDSDSYPLTHEFLSQMLGVRRASVTLAVANLKRQGAIEYRRGIITVVSREKLEAAACDCYRMIRSEYERLLTE